MFSSRLPPRLESNALARAVGRARAAGRDLIDLTVSNPTQAGIGYPAGMFDAFIRPEVATYSPEPFGLRSAREAVAADYGRRGVSTTWERIALTASTSEAYSLLFKLLCEPAGDSILVPAPSYPLFEHLTALDGVAARIYHLEYAGRWSVDFDSVDEKWNARTRAVLAVSPNNPTGSLLRSTELDGLAARCGTRGAALIVDEVFADYILQPSLPDGHDVPAESPALRFRLGGLSKSAALPQVKLGWISVDGPEDLVRDAIARLELICDTYLSVSTPVQVAAPDLIARGADARAKVLERVRSNYAELSALARRRPAVEVLNAEGGWSAVLRIPSRGGEEEIVLDLLDRAGVVVHPGFFFDFPREAYLVVSLLPDPVSFREGIRRVLERVDG